MSWGKEVQEPEQEERLQAYLDGELSLLEQREVEQLLQEDPALRSAYEALSHEKQWTLQRLSVLASSPPLALEIADIYARAAREESAQELSVPSQGPVEGSMSRMVSWMRQVWYGGARWGLGAAVGGFCVWMLWVNTHWTDGLTTHLDSSVPMTHPPHLPEPSYRPKGLMIQMVHARRKQVDIYLPTRTTRAKERLYPGDLIQFLYALPSPHHVMIVGINGTGQVFPLLPATQEKSIEVPAGKGTFPPHRSFILDHYVGLEQYFVFCSTKPILFAKVQKIVQNAWRNGGITNKTLKLPSTLFYKSFLIHKMPDQTPPL